MDSAAVAQAALEKQREDQAAALEKQQSEEQERIQQEHQKAVDQIITKLSAETLAMSSFKTNCEALLAANSNRIAGVSSSYRKGFTEQNDNNRDAVADLIRRQNVVLNKTTVDLPLLTTNLHANAQLYLSQVGNTFTQMDGDRQSAIGDLLALATSISNAPAKTSLFNFKLRLN